MRLPRRTPWKDLAEIEQLSQLIYGPIADLTSRNAALQMLNAWRTNVPLPHALEITASLLVVMIDDASLSDVSTSSHLGLRQSYALAIVRLVNNLVDPFQQGLYARPIASIAAQIGLPGWLVEIRHQATHDELPSLGVLREAAQEGLAWLLPNFFLPTTSSSIEPTSPEITSPPAITLLLLAYKNASKTGIEAQTSDRRHIDAELDRIGREIEQYINEAGVTFPDRSALELSNSDISGREEWVLSQLCGALLTKGALIPVSKKKRSQPSSRIDHPPSASIWSPLLRRIQIGRPSFVAQLVAALTEVFEHPDRNGISYKWAIIEWIVWTSEIFGKEVDECAPNTIVKNLLAIMGGGSLSSDDITLLKVLIKTLTIDDEGLRSRALTLVNTSLNLPDLDTSVSSIDDSDLRLMEHRLRQLGTALRPDLSNPDSSMLPLHDQMMDVPEEIAPGWTLRTHSDWKPAPMGVFVP